ncbi:MAG: PEP-CTERM sorting domain-containing protein [Planctomycetota bacterium]
MRLSRRPVHTLGLLSIVVSLFFLAGQRSSFADIVFWDPVDVERAGATLFRLDTGATGDSRSMDPGIQSDFEVAGFSQNIGGTFQNVGVRFSTFEAISAGGSLIFRGIGVATDGNTLGISTGRLLRLPRGTTIGRNTPFTNDSFAYDNSVSDPFKWEPGDSGFVGLQLSINGQTHYGWAGLDLGSTIGSQTLTSFAYETDPNTPILAGAVTAVPEPSSLALTGAVVGLIAVRRGRRPRLVSDTNHKVKTKLRRNTRVDASS